MCRRGPRRWRARSTGRGRSPRRPTRRRPGRTARRSGRGPRGGPRGRRPRTQSRTGAGTPLRADARSASPGSVCLTALSASWQHGLGDPLLVEVHPAGARLVEHPVRGRPARGPCPAATRVRSPRSTGRGCTKSGRRLLASRIRSPTSRLIRSTSSSSRARVRSTSSGSSVSSSSRWPRSTVSGVRSSWPASSRNRRCASTPSSSRSSMSLNVRVSAVMSSLPVSGMRRDRSVVVMSLRGLAHGAQRREQATRRAARRSAVIRPSESTATIA